ncbi:hypothetical protein ACQ86B_28740 (plasmid) [Mycolicibacterium aichiense]|uniref:hypothetical protein n=1 Tax=Mycolicibacterium aichiense TaxID=1799 RepID=UPI003D676DCF
MITNPGIATEATTVLGLVSRALRVFGGDTESRAVPAFAPPRHLEDDLGRGRF